VLKVESIDLKKLKIMISGIYRTKKDGTKISVYFDSSNLQIRELTMEDKKRIESINRKAGKKKIIEKETKTEIKEKTKETKHDASKKK
jgi:hypothetical protein